VVTTLLRPRGAVFGLCRGLLWSRLRQLLFFGLAAFTGAVCRQARRPLCLGLALPGSTLLAPHPGLLRLGSALDLQACLLLRTCGGGGLGLLLLLL